MIVTGKRKNVILNWKPRDYSLEMIGVVTHYRMPNNPKLSEGESVRCSAWAIGSLGLGSKSSNNIEAIRRRIRC